MRPAALPLTPSVLEASYEFLCATQPFHSWGLPPSDEIVFHVGASEERCGDYTRNGTKYPKGTHHITVSMKCVGYTATLLKVMSHEMIHLKQAIRKTETPNTEHNAEFRRLALCVCRLHGFDPREF